MTNLQRTQLTSRLEKLSKRQTEIERILKFINKRVSTFDSGEMTSIYQEAVEEAQSIQAQLGQRREYLFNFKGGGWNSEHAYTIEEAQEMAKKKYTYANEIDFNSFRASTPSDYQACLSLFY